MDEQKTLAEFASNLWSNYIDRKVSDKLLTSVSYFRAEVVSNNGDGTLRVQRPFDEEILVNTSYATAQIETGAQVIVLVFGGTNAMNYVAVSEGNGNNLGFPTSEYVTQEEMQHLYDLLGTNG